MLAALFPQILAALFAATGAALVSYFSDRLTKFAKHRLILPNHFGISKITFGNGKVEYLPVHSRSDEELSKTLDQYMDFERLVADAVSASAGSRVKSLNQKNAPDFSVQMDDTLLAIEAKLDANNVSSSAIAKLMSTEYAKMFLICRSPLTDATMRRLSAAVGGNRIGFLSGETIETLERSLKEALADYASKRSVL